MTIYYCADDNGFYDSSLKDDYMNSNSWPENLVKITEATYSELMAGQSVGRIISPDKHGKPVLINRIVDHVANAESNRVLLMNTASAVIAPLQDAVDLLISTSEEKEQLLAWKKYRVSLSRVDVSLAPDIVWPIPPVM